MPIVTLTTDFGNKDYSVGTLKGLLLSYNPGIQIVDITHNVNAFNIVEGAFVLKNAYPYFPQDTVHLITINDEDLRTVRLVAARYHNHYFVGLDNGLFTILFDNKEPDVVIELSDDSFTDNDALHGWKKLLALVAARLSNGEDIRKLGRPLSELKKKSDLHPALYGSALRGTVIYVDNFQNVIINITKDIFRRVGQNREFTLRYRNKTGESLHSISESYHDVPPGECLCRFNASGYLEIAINSGKASSLLGLKVGDYVQIDFQ
ncbi:MAG: hypothetical protein KatS3mg031_0436 [Chitinophagales bacterium]|nr:MAG: hypothetical protein KatS3mg031_0436 [Chitinophagales bacterium]